MAAPDTARAYADLLGRMRARTVGTVGVAWDALGAYDEDQVGRWLQMVVPVVAGAQRQAATLTAGYVRRTVLDAGGQPDDVVIDPEGSVGAAVRNGTPPEEVYRRPFVTVWTALKAGTPWVAAVGQGRTRALVAVQQDVQFAARQAAKDAMAGQPSIVGYRRVLGAGENCGKCITASTQRYHKSELMPIHARCRCTVAPIVGTLDPGQVINRERLDMIKAEMRKRGITFGTKDEGRLTHVRIDVVEHGEHGPTLVDADQAFTGPGDIAA